MVRWTKQLAVALAMCGTSLCALAQPVIPEADARRLNALTEQISALTGEALDKLTTFEGSPGPDGLSWKCSSNAPMRAVAPRDCRE